MNNLYKGETKMTTLNFIDSLFEITLELDGSLNKLNSETIDLQWRIFKNVKGEKLK